VVTENEGSRELKGRSYLGIGVLLALAGSVGLALLAVIVINTASSMREAISPPERGPVAAVVNPGGGGDGATSIAAGIDIAATMGCAACHSTNGTVGVGPTWSGLFGSERTFDDGSTAIADEAYLLESIVDPGARVVEGFMNGMMPSNFGDSLTDDELNALIAYIKSVG